jgi:hypothetical protein
VLQLLAYVVQQAGCRGILTSSALEPLKCQEIEARLAAC